MKKNKKNNLIRTHRTSKVAVDADDEGVMIGDFAAMFWVFFVSGVVVVVVVDDVSVG